MEITSGLEEKMQVLVGIIYYHTESSKQVQEIHSLRIFHKMLYTKILYEGALKHYTGKTLLVC